MNNEEFKKLQEAILAGNVPEMAKGIIVIALESGTSDIHIEPAKHTVRIRFRVDGMLREIIEYPSHIHSAMTARIKIMSQLRIDEQRKPQDGRLNMVTEDRRTIELRVSTLPTIHGEKICMRLQDKNKSIPAFTDLGIVGNNLDRMNQMIKHPNGINLVTGPTGSGKTTTLYSALYDLNKPEVNIMTLEDPVEYEMPGLSQSQVKPDIHYDFASGLKTALRQDPDIIMVGEIRDQETIEVAIKAALTGHMVLSTIHTNSAVGTITRILDMGIKPFKITSSMRTVQAQRLVRRICPYCKEEYKPELKVVEDFKNVLKRCKDREFDPNMLDNFTLTRGKGCEKCENLGYKGRLGIYEVMTMDRDIEKLVLSGALEAEIEDACIEKGMVTLLHDGYLKAMRGLTSLEEIMKIASGEH